MSEPESNDNPYLAAPLTEVATELGERRPSLLRLFVPLILLLVNLSPLVGTANGWIGPAKSGWFLLMGIGWLIFAPFIYVLVRPFRSTAARVAGVFCGLLCVLLGLAFNGWAVFVIESR